MTTDNDLADLRVALELLRAENARLRDELARKPHRHSSYFAVERDLERLQATVARVEALCRMQHDESLTSFGTIRKALRGEL